MKLLGFYFFSEDLISLEMRKTKTFMDKPIAVGFVILGFSKITLYKHWYRLFRYECRY